MVSEVSERGVVLFYAICEWTAQLIHTEPTEFKYVIPSKLLTFL